MVAGRPRAEATTTEAVKKELQPVCKATERIKKQWKFQTITKELIIILYKKKYLLLANQSLVEKTRGIANVRIHVD